MFETFINNDNEFKKDIWLGLSREKKLLPSKYFYDEAGCLIFNEITKIPDYYLTNCEIEILENNKEKITAAFKGKSLNVIELGPGEGVKTAILIEQLMKDSVDFIYSPIDVSMSYLQTLAVNLNVRKHGFVFKAVCLDYFSGLNQVVTHSDRQNMVLFLGSSIGNFDLIGTKLFVRKLNELLKINDHVLIGFDLRKDINILMKAYNDSFGITRKFNLNLLERINRELDADFDIDKFMHYGLYNIYSGAMESYLISNEIQQVHIKKLGSTFIFNEFEPIHVEYSYKYLMSQINEIAKSSGFMVIEHFFDHRKYFVDSLWMKCKNV